MEGQYTSSVSHSSWGGAPDATSGMGAVSQYAHVSRCLNGIIHDVNNYLGAIMAYAELIMIEAQLDAESRRRLGEINHGAKKCGDLITGLADIARNTKPVIAAVDPVDVVQRVLLLRAYDMRLTRIRAETRFEQPLTTIVADRARIQLALLCLVMNAQEALVECPQDRIIRISVRPEHDGIAFEVWDSGPPPPPDVAPHMFEPFVTTKGTGHFGLGLSFAREFAELHGGSLSYAPDTGFTLRLPAKSPLLPQGFCGPSV